MNVTEYNTLKTELGIIGSGICSKTKKQLNWKDGTFTPTDILVHLDFSEKTPSRVFVIDGDRVYKTKLVNAHSKFTGINKPPTMKTLQKYSWDGIAKTVTGKKTEPDGYGPDGSPSWMLVMEII